MPLPPQPPLDAPELGRKNGSGGEGSFFNETLFGDGFEKDDDGGGGGRGASLGGGGNNVDDGGGGDFYDDDGYEDDFWGDEEEDALYELDPWRGVPLAV